MSDPSPRHAILQIASGPEAFRKTVLAPGDRVRVGRDDEADLCLPRDPALGRLQFEVDWDGERAEIRARHGHLAPHGDTLLGGVPVVQSWVKHGAWIHAGSTDFLLYYEAHTPPRALPADTPARRTQVAAAIAALEAEPWSTFGTPGPQAALRPEPSLYGVFDSARDERVLVLLREAIDPHQSLYEGPRGLALASEAPYLVRFVPGSRLLRALVEEGWGEGWGVYLACEEPAKIVRRHLRRFLMVEEETSGQRLYFRWYDPRVLRDFLPLATMRQSSEMFGDVIRRWIFEGPDGEVQRADPPPAIQGDAPEGESDVSRA